MAEDLTEEQVKMILERAMPVEHRKSVEAAAVELEAERATLKAIAEDAAEKEAAFKGTKSPTLAQKQAFEEAVAAARTQAIVVEGVQRKQEYLGTIPGQLESVLKKIHDYCPSCRASAGLPPLEDQVAADELVQLEADIERQRAALTAAEAELAKRKGR